jgi:hypothetical protein
MAEEPKKIIVDDDWKAEARREKERLAEQEQKGRGEPAASASFEGLIHLIVMQALGGLGMLATPSGERFPPDLGVARHFIDLLQVLDEKTRNNLTPEEKRLLEQSLYEMRMYFVQVAAALGAAPPPASPPPATPAP